MRLGRQCLLLLSVALVACHVPLLAGASRVTPGAASGPLDRSVSRTMTPRQRASFAASDRRMQEGLREVEQRRLESLSRGIPATAWTLPRPEEGEEQGGVNAAISEGKVARNGEFPYMASLWNRYFKDSKGISHYCGATLVLQNVLLTAAHCVFGVTESYKFFWPEVVKVGSLRLHWDDTPDFFHQYEKRFPTRIIMHPKYDPGDYSWDIALIVLDRPVNTTVFRPVKLAGPHLRLKQGRTLFTAGWGKIEDSSTSEKLLYTYVPFVEREQCLRRQGSYNEGHMCAGGAGGADSCKGDSGGPLGICGAQDVQVGIVSYGPVSCGSDPKAIGYYSDVAYFRGWIDEVLKTYKLGKLST